MNHFRLLLITTALLSYTTLYIKANPIEDIEDVINGIFEQGGLSVPTINIVSCLDEETAQNLVNVVENITQTAIYQIYNNTNSTVIFNTAMQTIEFQIPSFIVNLPLSDALCVIQNDQTFKQQYQNLTIQYGLYGVNLKQFGEKAAIWISNNKANLSGPMYAITSDYLEGNYTQLGKDFGSLAQTIIHGVNSTFNGTIQQEYYDIEKNT